MQKLCFPVCAAFFKFLPHSPEIFLIFPIAFFYAEDSPMPCDLLPVMHGCFRAVLMEQVHRQVMVKKL